MLFHWPWVLPLSVLTARPFVGTVPAQAQGIRNVYLPKETRTVPEDKPGNLWNEWSTEHYPCENPWLNSTSPTTVRWGPVHFQPLPRKLEWLKGCRHYRAGPRCIGQMSHCWGEKRWGSGKAVFMSHRGAFLQSHRFHEEARQPSGIYVNERKHLQNPGKSSRPSLEVQLPTHLGSHRQSWSL